MWFLFTIINTIFASNDVILSSDVNLWDRSQLLEQYNIFSMYREMNIISSSSILVYNLDINGNLDTYKTNDTSVTAEDFQLLVKEIGLNSYPSLYCNNDGYCSNLTSRLDQLYKNQTHFIASVVQRIMANHADGFVINFKTNMQLDWVKLTSLLVELSTTLKIINKPLYIWIGNNTLYDDRIYSTPNIKLLLSNTYVNNYDQFIESATNTLIKMDNITRLGFTLLTSNNISEKDTINIIEWLVIAKINTISIWSSTVSGFYYKALHSYLK